MIEKQFVPFISRRDHKIHIIGHRLMNNEPIFITRKEVAKRYPISEHTLAKLASSGRGPRYYKPTDKVLYKPSDVEDWIASFVKEPSADAHLGKRPSTPKKASKNTSGGRGTYRRYQYKKPPMIGRARKSLPPSANSILLRSGGRPGVSQADGTRIMSPASPDPDQ